jgi:hypothetical protein
MMKKCMLLLSLIGLGLSACGLIKTTDVPLPAEAPVLKPTLPLPKAKTVRSAIEIQHEPGPDAVWNFGQSIALEGGVFAVGAPEWGDGPGKSGEIFVYEQQGQDWVEKEQLFAADHDDGFQYEQQLGSSVAMENGWLFGGAPYADDPKAGDNTGAVYVFREGSQGWGQVARLVSAEPAANANFGNSLAISGDWLAVSDGYENGRLYLFSLEGDAWRQRARLEMAPEEGYKNYLRWFDLYGDTLAINVQYTKGENENTQAFSRVSLYELQEGSWRQISILPFGDPTSNGGNLSSAGPIALDGSQMQASRMALVKYSGSNPYGSSAVMIYERGAAGWEPKASLTAPDSQFWDGFGGSVSLEGDLLLVGASGANEDSYWDGVAYVFEYYDGRWVEQLRLAPPEDGGFGDFFGSSVAIKGSRLLISAPNEFGHAVYVYDIAAQ